MFDLSASRIRKIDSYLAKNELQNEKGLEDYIEMILTQKAEMINWDDLSQQTRDYFDSRFANHGMDGETAFNHPHIIPHEAREELDSNGIEQLLRDNEISHIMPQAQYPDLASDYNNVVLESEELNRLRSDEIMTDTEVNLAKKGYFGRC